MRFVKESYLLLSALIAMIAMFAGMLYVSAGMILG